MAMKWKSDVELLNRDPNDLNAHIKVRFDEIFGEPEGPARTIDCCWVCVFCCFNCTLSYCYKVLTICCACPIAFCWACEFACLACQHIWIITPYINEISMGLVPIRKLIFLYLDTFIGPFCETCGLCCSRIAVTNRSG